MAINISGKPADYCPDNCPHMALDVVTNVMFSDNTIVYRQSMVYCKNEEVCRFHYERNRDRFNKGD